MFRVVSKYAVNFFFLFRSINVIVFFSGLEMFRVVSKHAVNFFFFFSGPEMLFFSFQV